MSSWLSFCLPGYVMYPCTYMYIPDNWAYDAYQTDNAVDIYQLETIIREQLRKACLPSYQDTLTQCTTELHITNAKVLTTTSQLQRTVPLRRNKLRFFLSTFLRMSHCPNRKLCGLQWCVSFHGQGTCSHPPRDEKNLFLLPVRGFFWPGTTQPCGL